MSPSQLDFGLHLFVGLSAHSILPKEKQLLEKLRPAGLIIFAHNIDSSSGDWQMKLTNLIQEVKELTARPNLLVGIDHEGGRVQRLPTPITHFPPAITWGTDAQKIGEQMGCELRSLGFNINFAPVLDVLANKENKVIGDRAFSEDPREVATFALSFIKGLESQGVLACVKHFPGHGSSKEDSHFELPVVDKPLDALFDKELVPFIEAISHGIDLVMTAHVLFPQIDSQHPATMSSAIITELLRKQLRFDRVVITDALEMTAMQNYSASSSLLTTLEAGADIALYASPKGDLPLERAAQSYENLDRKIASDLFDISQLKLSQTRVLSLLEKISALSAAPTSSLLRSKPNLL